VSPEFLIYAWTFGALAAFALLALWDEYRRRAFEPARQPDTIYRCDRCAAVYTDDPAVERSRCPQCGQTNQPVEF